MVKSKVTVFFYAVTLTLQDPALSVFPFLCAFLRQAEQGDTAPRPVSVLSVCPKINDDHV